MAISPSKTLTISSPSIYPSSLTSTKPSFSLQFPLHSSFRATFTHLRRISAVEASEKIEKLGTEISRLTLEEAKTLVDYLQNKVGGFAAVLSPAIVVAAGGDAAPFVEEKTKFDVILEDAGDNKAGILKAVRAITGLGLKQTKDLVDNLPAKLKEGLSKDEAEDIKKQLEEAGATVTIA